MMKKRHSNWKFCTYLSVENHSIVTSPSADLVSLFSHFQWQKILLILLEQNLDTLSL